MKVSQLVASPVLLSLSKAATLTVALSPSTMLWLQEQTMITAYLSLSLSRT